MCNMIKNNKKTINNTRFQNLLKKMKTFAERIADLTDHGSTSERLTKTSVGIKKEYLKGTHVCRVAFTLPAAAAPEARAYISYRW